MRAKTCAFLAVVLLLTALVFSPPVTQPAQADEAQAAAAPIVGSIDTTSAMRNGSVMDAIVAGTGFQDGAVAWLSWPATGEIIYATDTRVESAMELRVDLDLARAKEGVWDLNVTNPDGGIGTLSGGFTVTPQAGSNFYFAEGCTKDGFHEYLCLGNLNDYEALAHVRFLLPDGYTESMDISIPADSRYTLDVNNYLGSGFDVSLQVVSSDNIVAERPMYFSYPTDVTDGTISMGATATSRYWYFAEGYTSDSFREYVCILNPGNLDAYMTFYFQTQEEGLLYKDDLFCAAHSRATFFVNSLVGGGSYQTSLIVASSQPVVAERPMYFSYDGMGDWGWRGGHCVTGATRPAHEYYLAEGTTRPGFEEWLTLQNPAAQAITVWAEYQLGPGQGGPISKSYVVPGDGRITVFVANEVGPDKDVSIHLTSESPFLAERPIYFWYSYRGATWSGGHCVIGTTALDAEWFFAEGYTAENFDEWLCLQNPSDQDVVAMIYYLVEGYGSLSPRSVEVPAHSRVTVFVNDDAGWNLSLSAYIAANGPGIIVERPMYFNYGGAWTGGHDVVGMNP